jgi:hypothetical protein
VSPWDFGLGLSSGSAFRSSGRHAIGHHSAGASEFDFLEAVEVCRLMEPYRSFCVEDPGREEQFRTQIPKLNDPHRSGGCVTGSTATERSCWQPSLRRVHLEL